jgi:hypothetical protein
MESEALRRIRTMREVRTGSDVARGQRLRTTNNLGKTREEAGQAESPTDRRTEQTLEKEKRRFAAYEASVDRSRQRMLASREKLAMTLHRNQALTELRHQLQRSRLEGSAPAAPKVPAHRQSNRQIELRY